MSDDTKDLKRETAQRLPSARLRTSAPPPRSTGELLKDPVAFAFWLSSSFPDASAREDQIRRAASVAPPPAAEVEAMPRNDQPAPHQPAPQVRDLFETRLRTVRPARPESPPVADEQIPAPAAGFADKSMQMAADLARTNDPRQLAEKVWQAIDRAASGLAMPEDMLPELQAELLGYRLGDAVFRSIVAQEGNRALAHWAGQGRRHDVFDPLLEAAAAQDWNKLSSAILAQFEAIAALSSTGDALASHVHLLLNYGPRQPVFPTTVKRLSANFLTETPRQHATDVEQTLRTQGPLAASARLRQLTDPEKCDPLTAGRIFAEGEKCIADIVGQFGASIDAAEALSQADLKRDPGIGRALSLVANTPLTYAEHSAFFSNIAASCESASRSEEGLLVVNRLARLMHGVAIDAFVITSVSNGAGTLLPLEIAHARSQSGLAKGADEVAFHIEVGLRELLEKIRGAVIELDETASSLTEMAKARQNASPAAQPTARRRAIHSTVQDFDAQLSALNRHCYALTRALNALDSAAPWLQRLANYQALRVLRAAPDNAKFEELRFALTIMPSSIAETLRTAPREAHAGAPMGIYAKVRAFNTALQGLKDFRRFLATAHEGVSGQ